MPRLGQLGATNHCQPRLIERRGIGAGNCWHAASWTSAGAARFGYPNGRRIANGIIPGLDEMMGGGIPAGDVSAILGPSGSGKTIAALRFVACGPRLVVQGRKRGENRCG
jgi:KaiC